MPRTRLTLTLFATIAVAASTAIAQNAAEPPAAPAAARAAAPPPNPNAAADMIAPPPTGGGAAAGFAIRPNARLVVARPRPSQPVSTSVAPHPHPHPHQPVDDPIAAPPPPRTNGPRVLSTLTRVEGGITRANALRVMPQIEARAAQCFTRALSTNPSVQGLMVIRFGIGPAGNVTSIEEAANYVRDTTLSDCLTASFPGVRFPPYTASAPALAMVQIRFLQR